MELARRSRGTPRLANRLLKRVRDFAQVKYDGVITREVTDFALDIMDVDKLGLDQNDRNILLMIIEKVLRRPRGIRYLAAALGEDSGTLEEVYEPYLLMNGLINRTPKGPHGHRDSLPPPGARNAETALLRRLGVWYNVHVGNEQCEKGMGRLPLCRHIRKSAHVFFIGRSP